MFLVWLGVTVALGSPCPGLAAQRAWDEWAVEQWLFHEVRVNQPVHVGQRDGFVAFAASKAPVDLVTVRWSPRADGEIRKAVGDLLGEGEHLWWPHHPKNQDPRAPFFSWPRAVWRPGHFTASRSTVVRADEGSIRYLGLKLPKGDLPNKVSLVGNIQSALDWEDWFHDVDRKLPPMPREFRILSDVAAFIEPTSRNGFMIRDLRPITRDVPIGRVWVPAFSVAIKAPHFALALEERVAAINAEMLLRYSYWPSNPHNQQYVVLVHRDYSPVGPIAIRDIGDGMLYFPMLEALGEFDVIKREMKAGELRRDSKYLARRPVGLNTHEPMELFRRAIFRRLAIADPLHQAELHDALRAPEAVAAIRRFHGLQ